MSVHEEDLTVAVTGPTGTFGFGLMPALQQDDRIAKVVGIARRPFDPAAHGWTKMEYRRGDVRDLDALKQAFRGADVVVHLAFLIVGGSRSTTRAINIEGTLNAFRAAVAAGARRFVYASSVAAYGFHRDNPVGMTEDWPTRPAERLFYSQEKAELEHLLAAEAAKHPDLGLYVVRPAIVLGPHAVGAKVAVPEPLRRIAGALARAIDDRRIRVPLVLPELPLQLIHEDDVARALVRCIVGSAPAGAYNIAGRGVVTTHDIARELGLLPLPFPTEVAQRAARMVASLPLPDALPPVTGWAEAFSHPAIMDTTKAERDLGWSPRFSGAEALHVTLHPDPVR